MNFDKHLFPFPVKIYTASTGHTYIRPVNNLVPFTMEQERIIRDIARSNNFGTIRNRVKSNYNTEITKEGFGYRLFQLSNESLPWGKNV